MIYNKVKKGIETIPRVVLINRVFRQQNIQRQTHLCRVELGVEFAACAVVLFDGMFETTLRKRKAIFISLKFHLHKTHKIGSEYNKNTTLQY